MREDAHGVGVVEGATRPLRAAMGLQLHEALDKGVGQTRPQRIAHRDVDPPDLGRQGVQQRQEQILVGQHYGGTLVQRPRGGQFAQDRGGVFALHGVRHRGHGGQLLGPLHVVVRHGPARRELHDVLADEHPGLLLGAVLIVGVVIPIEIGLGSGRKEAEEHLFALRQGVETRHDIPSRLREGVPALADAVGSGTLDHAVIGDAQFGEAFAETAVDGSQRLPDGQELAFLGRKVGLVAQRRPEAQDLQLRGSKVRDVGLDLLDLRDVAEQHCGVDPVFVDGVEIRQEHVAPEVEFVERLGVILRIDLVEFGDEPHAVARMQARDFGHEVIDGHPLRLPHGPSGDSSQGIDEKQPRTPRRKEQRTVGQPLAVAFVKVPGDFVEKSQDYEF